MFELDLNTNKLVTEIRDNSNLDGSYLVEVEEKLLNILPDLDMFIKGAIGKSSPLEIIVKGHLFIEKEITQLLRINLKEPLEIIKKSSPTFANKLELAVALGALTKDEKNSLKKLNKIRNNFAHESEYIFSGKDFDDLWSTLTSEHKDIFTNLYNTFKMNGYNVDTPVAKFQLALIALWTHLRSAVDIGFPHKKRMKRMLIRMEILREEQQEQVLILQQEADIKQEQIRKLKDEGRKLKEETAKIQEESRKLKEETRVLQVEAEIKREQIRILEIWKRLA
jgi:hypothetical protein